MEIKTRLRNSWSTCTIYSALALAVLLPLLKPGYILALDMVFTPELRMPTTITSSYLLHASFHILNVVLPSQLIEKVMLFLILALSGVGMHRLVQYLDTKRDAYQKFGAYFAGVFYMVNPFTYDRFMVGQYNVLLGYALLPWFARALLTFTRKPTIRAAVTIAAWMTVIGITSVHTLGFAALLAGVGVCIAALRRRRQSGYMRNLLRFGLISVGIFAVASSYWLVPLALGKGGTAATIDSFSKADQSAFATVGGSWMGRAGNVLRLQGFWAEARGMYTLPQDVVPVWGLLALMIWILIVVGGVRSWRTGQRSMVVLFGASACIAGLLAVGTLNDWLAVHIPFFAGYREPEKFVALVALAFAIFAGRGISAVLQYLNEQGGTFFMALIGTFLLLVPVVWTPTMWWGFNNQLASVQYPADWFAMNQRLNADHGHFQTLFLPWHLYMYFDFSGRIITNPAPGFFDKPMIISDNPEFRGAALTGSTLAKRHLDRILSDAKDSHAFSDQLASLNIKYILLAEDDDYLQYAYLDKQPALKLVAKSATLELYRNEAWKGGEQ